MKRPMMPGPVPFSTRPAPRDASAQAQPQAEPAPKVARPQPPTLLNTTRRNVEPIRARVAQPAKRKRSSAGGERTPRRVRMVESLETRQVFAAPTLNPLADLALPSGAPMQVALDGNDADGDTLSYTATSSNPNIVAELRSSSNRILRLEVSYAGDGGANPAFSGVIEFVLFEDLAAPVAGRIIELVQSGFYDGLIFHRVINNFVIQGGDPLGNGTGGSGVKFDDFFNADLQHTGTGLLSMAKTTDDTNDSQFFITEGPTRSLDFHHSIFGKLVEGEDLREMISNLPVGTGDKPTVDVVITKATIVQNSDDQVLTVKAADGYTGTGTVTVEVSDGNGGTTTRTFAVNATPDTTNNNPYFVNLPTSINATVNTPTTLQLQAIDVDSGTKFYGAVLFDSADADKLTVSIDESTGLLTLTPKNGFTGVVSVFVGVTQSNFGNDQVYDSQQLAVFIAPAAPTGIDLLNASDSGVSATDNVTKLNNSGDSTKLTFRVSGVISGMTVGLYDGNTLIGQAVATGTTVDITTNGTAPLADGLRNITAKQGKPGTTYTVGNDSGTTDLNSVASPALALTIDTAVPVFTSTPIIQSTGGTYVYNAQTDQEGAGLGYALLNGPSGMTINNTTGVVTWTPTAQQIAAGSAAVSILATDAAGNAANQTYTIFFAPNEAPVLAPIGNQTTDEHVTLNVTLSATDPNQPGDVLTYSIVGTPANATINASTGVFSFTPDDTQGGGTFSFTVRVTDGGGLTSEQTFSVSVNDTNSNPAVLPIGSIPALENKELVYAIPAFDEDLPANSLTFTLLSAPAGATLDAQGVLRWTPGEFDGGTLRNVSVLVEDGVGGTLTVNFTIDVAEENLLPTLTVQQQHSVDELSTLTFQATATDSDAPAQTLTFGLVGAPTGMTINAATGVVTWTPGEAQGPGQFSFQVRVQDALGGSATQTVTVVVGEVNQAPGIGFIAGQSIFQGGNFQFAIPGFDGDLPAQALTYSLLSGPAGMTIDPSTGALAWSVPGSGATGTYDIRIGVADSFGLTAFGGFSLTVSDFNFSTFGFANGFFRSISQPTQPVLPQAVIRAEEVVRDETTIFIPPAITTDLLEDGLNRIQAVNDEELLQNVQKPVIEDRQVLPAGNQSESKPASGTNTPSAKPTSNPFDDIQLPSAPLSVPDFDRSGQTPHRLLQLRGLVLADEAADGPALPWNAEARNSALNLALTANTRSRRSTERVVAAPVAMVEPTSDANRTLAVATHDTPTEEPVTPSIIAAVTAAAVVAPALIRERKRTPAALPMVDAAVANKRGERRRWFF